jgi:hypothetical protein
MLRRSFTAVLEKNSTFRTDFATEPYEAGWAAEARWFVHVLEVDGSVTLRLSPQVSPDGLHWCDEGAPPMEIDCPGIASVPLRNFGSWLRLSGQILDRPGSVRVLIYLALKE